MVHQHAMLVITVMTMFLSPVHSLAFRGSLPLITHPCPAVRGQQEPTAEFKTIMDPPNELLANGKESILIVPVDHELDNILLRIPNEFNWNCHFGYVSDEDPREKLSHALLCAEQGQLVLNEAGIMFFTFRDQGDAPMRIKVYPAMYLLIHMLENISLLTKSLTNKCGPTIVFGCRLSCKSLNPTLKPILCLMDHQGRQRRF